MRTRAWRRACAAVAFGAAAPIYDLLTDHDLWRRSCRGLGALVPGPRVLDLGVGPGGVALAMASGESGKRHVGLDVSGEMLARAARAARAAGIALPLVRADAASLPLRDGAFDGVTGHSFLYLLPDPRSALAEVRRVLRPGGRAAFLEPRAGTVRWRAFVRHGARSAPSLVLWRGMSWLQGRFAEDDVLRAMSDAGLVGARAWPVLDGLATTVVAERPS